MVPGVSSSSTALTEYASSAFEGLKPMMKADVSRTSTVKHSPSLRPVSLDPAAEKYLRSGQNGHLQRTFSSLAVVHDVFLSQDFHPLQGSRWVQVPLS